MAGRRKNSYVLVSSGEVEGDGLKVTIVLLLFLVSARGDYE